MDLPGLILCLYEYLQEWVLESDPEVKTEDNLLSKAELLELEQELSKGEGIKALVDFNNAVRQLPPSNWGKHKHVGRCLEWIYVLESKLQQIFGEWCFNLESFNPAFAAVLLQVGNPTRANILIMKPCVY